MKHIILALLILLLALNVFALNVSIVSEKHSIINHEIIFDVSTIGDSTDTTKTWDLNLFGLTDKQIVNPIYEMQVVQTIQVPVRTANTIMCDEKKVHKDDLNVIGENYFCWSKDTTQGTIGATKLYPCQSQILCTNTTYNDSTEPKDIIVWQGLGVVNKTITYGKTSLNLPIKVFPKATHTLVRVSFQTPITKDSWGSVGNWAMNPASWWNATWIKKRQITITNNNPSVTMQDGNNVILVRITNELGANALANCNDVRIVKGDILELDRNVFGNCQSDANIWFNLPTSIAGGGTDNNYYLYYGNVTASAPTNPSNLVSSSIDLNTSLLLPFDNASTATIGLTPSVAGTITYNTTRVNGTHSAGGFSASNYFSYTAGNNRLPTTGSWTIEAWIYMTTIGTIANYIYAQDDLANPRSYVFFFVNSLGTLKAQINNNDTACGEPSVASALGTNKWYHVALTKNVVTNKLEIYLDGVKSASITNGCSGAWDAPASTIGAQNTDTSNYMRGYIDDFRITSGTPRTQYPQNDMNGTLHQTTSLGAETQNVIDANITFNVYRTGTSTHLTNVTADWNVNAYDVSGQNSPFTQDVNIANYLATFSRTGYDNNTNFFINADTNKTYTIYLADSTAPTTSATGCGAGWNKNDQNITFSCSDSGSGCSATAFKIDLGAWQTTTTTLISTDGNHRVDYNSTDVAGNLETTKTTYCAVDKTTPTYLRYDGNGFHTSSFYVNVYDLNYDISGKQKAQFRIDAGAWTNFATDYNVPITIDGNYRIDFNFTDNANNSLLILNIDANLLLPVLQPPTISITYPVGGEHFTKGIDNTINVQFILTDLDSIELFLDLNYSDSNAFGTGTPVLIEESTAGANIICDSYDFTTPQNCAYLFTISSIADGNYFILMKVSDTNATDENRSGEFTILTQPTPTTTTTPTRYINPQSDQRDTNRYFNPNSALSLTDSEKQILQISETKSYIFVFGVIIVCIMSVIVLVLWKKRR